MPVAPGGTVYVSCHTPTSRLSRTCRFHRRPRLEVRLVPIAGVPLQVLEAAPVPHGQRRATYDWNTRDALLRAAGRILTEDAEFGLSTLMIRRAAVSAAVEAGAIGGDTATLTVGPWAVVHGRTSLEFGGSLAVGTDPDAVWTATVDATLAGLRRPLTAAPAAGPIDPGRSSVSLTAEPAGNAGQR